MHDCQRTSAKLTDLVYDGGAGDAASLRAEVEGCPACRAELRALAETLRAFDRAAAWQQLGEDEWAGYQTRLAARLRGGDSPAARARLPLAGRAPSAVETSNAPAASLPSPPTRGERIAAWPRRALTATWRVPAPAAVASLALLVACLTLLALRPPRAADAPPPRPDASAPVRIVEVPVVREKIVTRTVYVARRASPRPKRETRSSPGELARGAGAGRKSAAADTLIGFRPADDVKLRVIKGNYANEK